MKAYKFITLEGIEGSGKTTTAKILSEILEEKGINTFVTREPGGSGLTISERIRQIIFKEEHMDTLTELLLFEASRREHVTKVIQPNIEKGNLVICDRFSDSSIVYQGIVLGLGKEVVEVLNNITIGKTIPEKTFIFDVDVEEALNRISVNQDREITKFDIKSIDFHKKIRQGYLDISKTNPKRYVVINASNSPRDIAMEIINILDND